MSGGMSGVWVSGIIGIICLMLSQSFVAWLFATITGQAYNTGVNWTIGDKAGQPVSFFELQGGTAFTQLGTFLLGVTLIVEAVVLLLWFRGVVKGNAFLYLCVTLAALALVANLGVAFYLFSIGITPLFSLLAAAVAGMVLFDRKGMIR